MRTKTYAQLMELIQAKCGVIFASNERPRIKALINARATSAYDASDYWARFLVVGEERQLVSGIIPFEQNLLRTIETFLYAYRFQPFDMRSSQYLDMTVGPLGATPLITGLDLTSVWVTYKAVNPDEYGDGSQGEQTNIPSEWFQYIAHGTYSDFMRAEGQQEKAIIADQEANELLQSELIKLSTQGTIQLAGNRISTTGNMQNRTGGGYWP